MINVGKVQGNEEQARFLIVGKTTVYVHSNIVKLPYDEELNPDETLYEYDEIRYGKDEYIELMATSLNSLLGVE